MDFEKKYPITQKANEYLLVQWTRGYKQVDVYFGEKLIGSVSGTTKLMKGTSFLSELGEIKLKLSEKPVMLDVIVDGYHSPGNVSHPVRELKAMNTYFWIISVCAFIAGAVEVGIFSDWVVIMLPVFMINLIILALYVVSAVFVGKGKPWAFYLGFSVFSFFTLISFLALAGGLMWGMLLYVFMVLRIGGEVLLIINLKTANAAVRHLRYKGTAINNDLLDTKI